MHLHHAIVALALAPVISFQDHDHRTPKPQKLGTVQFATSCTAAAQPHFTRAVALLHSFGFPDAIAAFETALRSDAQCAIAYWGLALSAWGNPFAASIRPEPLLRRGREAVERGRAANAKTERERDYISAAARLFENATPTDQPQRLAAYRDAMQHLASRYPDDVEAAIFYALALAIAADPADKTYASQLKAGAILERLAAERSDHPGLAHYIIHNYDVPPLASRALGAARRYAKIAPSLSHPLHMPSHTFTRVGLWHDSIATNRLAAAAAQREKSVAEELHASDYMMYAYLQTARDAAAKSVLDALPEMASRFDPDHVGTGAPPAAGFFSIAALPARYALERGDWKQAASLQLRDSPVPYANAVTHFTRALGAARTGQSGVATSAIAALERIRDQLAEQQESYWSEQVEIQRITALAWVKRAQGDPDALTTLRAAAARESATEKNVLMPGPLAPARELLGEMLLELNDPASARREFEKTLEREPDRFRALLGAARAAFASGDHAAARQHYSRLLKVAERADPSARPELEEARRAVSLSAQRLDNLPVRMEQREITVGGSTLTYGLLIPKTPPDASGYPLILALHYATAQDPGLSPYFGLGYVGQVVFPGLGDLNAVIVAPDAPEATWSHQNSERAVLAILEQVRKEFKIDNRRTLVTGFSMGGHGAWFFAANHPTLFRAAIPMASMPVTTRAATNKEARAAADTLETTTEWTKALASTPVYVIHSRADASVPFPALERAIKILASNGGRVTLAAIDDVPHSLLSGYIEPLQAATSWVRKVWADAPQ